MKQVSHCVFAIACLNLLSTPVLSAVFTDGTDTFPSQILPLQIQILSNPFGIPLGTYTTSSLLGQTSVLRTNGDGDGDNDGLGDIRTQFLSSNQSGTILGLGLGIQTHQSPTRPTFGVVEQQIPGVNPFPANSFFDVFFELEIQGLPVRLYNTTPVRETAVITSFPPAPFTTYFNNQGTPSWWPSGPLDPLYLTGAALNPLPLGLFADVGGTTLQVGNLISHPSHVVTTPELGWTAMLFSLALIGLAGVRRKITG